MKTRRPASLFWFLCAAGLLLLWSALIAQGNTLLAWEIRVLRLLNNLPSVLIVVFYPITLLGSVLALMGFVITNLFKKHLAAALAFIINGTSVYLLTVLGKLLIGRSRPLDLLHNVSQREVFIDSFGFPSGHTAMATVLALTCRRLWPQLPQWIAWVWVLVVAISRLYLGVHAPLDLIGGAALGVLVFYLVDSAVTGPLSKLTKGLEKDV
jgi:glycosyltransferase 2 family protein